jgi:hypothetical protein
MFNKNALQLRIDPLFAKTFVPTSQAVLDAHALDFLEAFRGSSLISRNLEEMTINLLLPPRLSANRSGYKPEYWCAEVQQRGIQCEFLDADQILQAPLYPQLLPPASPEDEEDAEEALSVLIRQLFEQCGQETTAVNYKQVPGFYQEGWSLSQAEIDQSSFWRFTLLFGSQKLIWYRHRPGEDPLTLPTIEEAFSSLVRQCTVVAQYPDWIAYNTMDGDGTAESAYKHAQIYPVWQKEVGSLYRLVGPTIFDRLLGANFE